MNVLTFDIEEWFVYKKYPKGGEDYYLPIIDDYLNKLLAILKKKELKATFFCLGKVAEEYPYVIEKIVEYGHEIGCHSYEHKIVTEMTPEEFYEDTRKAKEILEKVSGQKVVAYRAPAFSFTESNKWVYDVLVSLGFEYDCSIFPIGRSPGGYPSFPTDEPAVIRVNGSFIKVLPIKIDNIFGVKTTLFGGGYFRLAPYSFIKSRLKQNGYTMSYFHIRDFDAQQKHVFSLRYFKSYYGVKSAFDKLSRYINENDFVSLYGASELTNWKEVASINLDEL